MLSKHNYSEKLISLAQAGKIPHAMILEDVELDRALEFAKLMSKVILCDSESEKPCNVCGNCVKVDSGSHTDVTVVSPEQDSHMIKIDSIRRLREEAHIYSCEGKQKIYILHRADRMNAQAQNAFIKILEEPPKNVIFVLICKSAMSLLSTVRSRCQIYSNSISSYNAVDNEIMQKAKLIVQASRVNRVDEIMRLVSSTPNDRNYLGELIDAVLNELIRGIRCKEIGIQGVSDKVVGLYDLFKSVEKNININLAKCMMMAILTE